MPLPTGRSPKSPQQVRSVHDYRETYHQRSSRGGRGSQHILLRREAWAATLISIHSGKRAAPLPRWRCTTLPPPCLPLPCSYSHAGLPMLQQHRVSDRELNLLLMCYSCTPYFQCPQSSSAHHRCQPRGMRRYERHACQEG